MLRKLSQHFLVAGLHANKVRELHSQPSNVPHNSFPQPLAEGDRILEKLTESMNPTKRLLQFSGKLSVLFSEKIVQWKQGRLTPFGVGVNVLMI